MKQLICYFDGCCEPKNPGGNMGIGSVIYSLENDEKPSKEREIFNFSEFIEADFDNSNNVAEYLAFEKIITWLRFNNIEQYNNIIYIYGDSNLVIQQMQGNWRIKQGYYVPIAKRCLESLVFLREACTLKLQWIPREKNSYADEISKRELVKNNIEFKIQPL